MSVAAQKNIAKVFAVKWKVPIGITTYRTNMIEHEGLIYIGSNGENRESRTDPKDGVFAIDAKTGKVVHQYTIPFGGDNDVTGIAIGDGKLFFGTDNYYFFCFDLKTHQELWKYHLPYDVESCPALADLNGDKFLDAIFSVQHHGFYALNGKNGELIWLNEQISSHEGNVAPLLSDLNGDGVKDIISAGRGEPNSDRIAGFKMAHYGDYHLAIDGKSGEMLWMLETGAGVHSSPFLLQKGKETEIYLLDSYGELRVADQNGKLLKFANLSYGPYASPYVTNDGHLVVATKSVSWKPSDFERENDTLPFTLNDHVQMQYIETEGVATATTMIADVLGKGYVQMVGVTENGELFIAKTDGTLISKLRVPGGAEASLFIRDIDGDKELEILLASLDGYLYCFKTNSQGKVEYGHFH